jgi:hypothetical protein
MRRDMSLAMVLWRQLPTRLVIHAGGTLDPAQDLDFGVGVRLA